MNEKTFRYATWLRLLIGASILVFLGALVAGYQSSGWLFRLTFLGLLAFSLAALAETTVSKIELQPEGVAVSTLFKKRFINREDVESVTWEAGSGVSLKLKGDEWMKLPDLGLSSPVVANSIRTWIKGGTSTAHE